MREDGAAVCLARKAALLRIWPASTWARPLRVLPCGNSTMAGIYAPSLKTSLSFCTVSNCRCITTDCGTAPAVSARLAHMRGTSTGSASDTSSSTEDACTPRKREGCPGSRMERARPIVRYTFIGACSRDSASGNKSNSRTPPICPAANTTAVPSGITTSRAVTRSKPVANKP